MTIVAQTIGEHAAATLAVAQRGTTMDQIIHHQPVMVQEVLDLLSVGSGKDYIDGTIGEGGHSAAILAAAGPDSRLLGLDLDPAALESARARLTPWLGSVVLVQDSYSQVGEVARAHEFAGADGILLDLGFSSFQLEGSGRGFSFRQEEPLDMRFDPASDLTAEEIVNTYPLEPLASIIARYGEEPRARALARAIIQGRPFSTSHQLAEAIARVAGRRGRVHPATRTFQALRIAVNSELDRLRAGIDQAIALLKPAGRLAIISYHSLEDRIVKQAFTREARNCICPPRTPACICGHVATIRLVNRRPMTPSLEEMRANPRGRSARLRAAERLAGQGSSATGEEPAR